MFFAISSCLLRNDRVTQGNSLFYSRGVQPFGVSGPHIQYTTLTKTDEQKQGLCMIFVISATTDKRTSPHVIILIIQWTF